MSLGQSPSGSAWRRLRTASRFLYNGYMDAAPRICDYLIQRLYALGVRHVFGIPGDYVLGFLHEIEAGPLQMVNTCDEQGAGFAAARWDGQDIYDVGCI